MGTDYIAELDYLETLEYIATEVEELSKNQNILGESITDWD